MMKHFDMSFLMFNLKNHISQSKHAITETGTYTNYLICYLKSYGMYFKLNI